MRTLSLLGLCLAAAASPGAAQQSRNDSLDAAVRARIAAATGATVGLYFHDLVSDDTLVINADARFHAASTMKVPVMIQVFRDVDAGRLSLDARVPVTNAFRSLVDSAVFSVDSADDSDKSLYREIGNEVRMRELVQLMITRSSNLATDLVIERVGPERIRASLHAIGADSMIVLRGVEDGAAYRAGLNNTTTARGLGIVMEAIADGRAASAASCGAMLDILLDNEDRAAIVRGLPRHTHVAHKTGDITNLRHDAAIVYVHGHPRYVLVVLTSGIPIADANVLIADIARSIHERFIPIPRPHRFGTNNRE
jgi:beta-lactamase class A